MKHIETLIACALVIGSAACGPTERTSRIKEAMNQRNLPERLDYPMDWIFNVGALPKRGDSKTAVWSGNWWPMYRGGTVEAMKKYDKVTGAKAAEWELATVATGNHESWAGHCNGLASAGIHERRPRHPVVYKGVQFSVSDVEALLVEKWQGSRSVPVVGRRCNKQAGYDANGRIIEEECRDFNAGAFHLLLTNMLGRKGTAFVLDIDAGAAVWNYPVVWFKSEIQDIAENEARSLTFQKNIYQFNLQATGFRKVSTHVLLANGLSYIYDYILELRENEIVGGEWIGLSAKDHPDFGWYMSEANAANPHLNLAIIDEIAAASY